VYSLTIADGISHRGGGIPGSGEMAVSRPNLDRYQDN